MSENTYEKQFYNILTAVGTVKTSPVFSHTSFNENFYQFYLSTERLSGEADVLPVIIPELFLPIVQKDARLKIEGQIRTFNEGKHLIINIFAQSCSTAGQEKDYCEFQALAYICKTPVFRSTPNGREITDLLLAVNRRFNKSDYIPAIAWGRNAHYAKDFNVGDHISVEGRLQSRTYNKKHEDGTMELLTTYELSLKNIEYYEG